jgi:hypothetical protein
LLHPSWETPRWVTIYASCRSAQVHASISTGY